MDRAWWREHDGALGEFSGQCVAPVADCPSAEHVNFASGRNSGAGAMALAERFGARRIILLGYDCKISGGKTHWHGDHPKPLGNAGSVGKWPAQFADMAGQLGHVDIVNATRDTALKHWPEVSLEQALASEVCPAHSGSPFLIVSAATAGSRYVECLDRQRAKHGAEVFLGLEVPDRGSWAENTKIKPAAILSALGRSKHVLWVDADCDVSPPSELPPGEWDICTTENIHPTHKNRISAAFILFKDTPATRQFLADWAVLNQTAKKDHPAFVSALRRASNLRVGDMTAWLKGLHTINAFARDRGEFVSCGVDTSMRINVMPCRMPLKGGEWPQLLRKGMESVGDKVRFSQAVGDDDLHVFWGMRRSWGKAALQAGKKCLVVERAYLGDRFKWHALGFNGLNGLADFCNESVPDDRWRKYWRHTAEPWKESGDYALIIGQVPGDAALRGLDVGEWVGSVVEEARQRFGKVYFRPHPLARKPVRVPGVEVMGGDLAKALSGASAVITYNSNTAVDAVMAGVPAICFDRGSMAWDVCSHSISEPLYRGDRDDWGRKIAYAQWLPEELSSGAAWRHLRESVWQPC